MAGKLLTQIHYKFPSTKPFIVSVLALLFSLTTTAQNLSTYDVEQTLLGTTVDEYTHLVYDQQVLIDCFDTANTNTDNVETLPIGFTFVYNSQPYTTLKISSRGWVSFGTNTLTGASVNPLTGFPAENLNVINVLTADWRTPNAAYLTYPSSAGYTLDTSGGPGNSILKIEWRNLLFHTGTLAHQAGNDLFSFQLWLYEADDRIEFYHKSKTPGNNTLTNVSAYMGLRAGLPGDTMYFRNIPAQLWNEDPVTPIPLLVTPANANTLHTVGFAGTMANNRAINSFRKYIFRPKNCLPPSGVGFEVPETSLTDVSATVNFVMPSQIPTLGVEYEVLNAANAVVATGIVTSSPFTVNGLTASSTYTIRLRSKCSVGVDSIWNNPIGFTTLCTPSDVPYALNFVPATDGFTVPNIPICSRRLTIGSSGDWTTMTEATAFGFTNPGLRYNYDNIHAANAWFYTGGVNLQAGVTYRLGFKYGGDAQVPTILNKLKVFAGTSRAVAAMNIPLADLPTIRGVANTIYLAFEVPADGVYFLGFQAYSDAGQGAMYIDDITIDLSSCFPPTALNTTIVGSTTAVVNFTVPATLPSNGYNYYLSTSATAPTSASFATGNIVSGANVVNLTGLLPNTTYYLWIRSMCAENEFSKWSQHVSFTTDASAYCIPAPTSQDGAGITNVSFANVNNTTGIEVGGYGDYSHIFGEYGIGDTASLSIRLETGYTYNVRAWVDWNKNGSFESSEQLFFQTTSNAIPSIINRTFVIPNVAIGDYRLRIGGADINDLSGYGANQGPCYVGSYASFEDYTLRVLPPRPALALTSTSSENCAGAESPLVNITAATIGNYDVYTWVPAAGVSGTAATGYTFTNSATTTYTLRGTQSSPPYSYREVTYTNTIMLTPPAPVVSGSDVAVCPQGGTPVALTITGGGVQPVEVIKNDFEGIAPGSVALSGNWEVGGEANAGRFTVRQNGYNSGFGTVNSNDNSQFFLANSDATWLSETTLTSFVGTFSLTGITNPTLSFYHNFIRYNPAGCTALVRIRGRATAASTLSGWTNLQTWTQTVGTRTNFAQQNYSLSGYAGYHEVQIEFLYTSEWGFHWAIDNIVVSGSSLANITWEPVEGLYIDAAATTAYTGQNLSSVYALPESTTVYNAIATASYVPYCNSRTEYTVEVRAAYAGDLPDEVVICDGLIPAIELENYNGEIVGWETSPVANFGSGVTYVPFSDGVDVMTSAVLGTVSSPMYLRAIIETAYCTTVSEPVYLRLENTTWNGTAWSNGLPTANKLAIFNGNYSSTDDITACGILVNSGNVVINSGHVMLSTTAVKVMPAGSLTFEDTASLIQVDDAAVNVGQIVYKRNTTPVRRYDFTYWSAPVSPLTLANVSPLTLSDKYFQFNTISGQWEMLPSSTAMTVGKGYIIRAPQTFSPSTYATYNAEMVGTPNNGVVTMPIVHGGSDLNLLGNPYPSAMDADLLLTNYALNSNVLAGTLYFWTHNTTLVNNNYDSGDYAVYTLTGGVVPTNPGNGNSNEPNGKIAAGQGFFASATATGGTITIDNSYRIDQGNDRFYRLDGTNLSQHEKHRYWVNLTNESGNLGRQVLVGYLGQATAAKDAGYDGELIANSTELQLYTLIDTEKMAVQGRGLPFDTADRVAVGYIVNQAGTYTFELGKRDGIFTTQLVYLEDLLTGSITPLTADSTYSFTSLAGEFNDRFVFRYTNETLGNPDLVNDRDLIAYRLGEGIQVKSTMEMIKKVAIYDVQGRLLASVNSAHLVNEQWVPMPATEQLVLVVIEDEKGHKITKKVNY